MPFTVIIIIIFFLSLELGMVTHVCNPSNSKG